MTINMQFINMVYESDTNELQKEEDGDEECNKVLSNVL